MNTSHLLRALGLGLVAPALYFLFRIGGWYLGYSIFPRSAWTLPASCFHHWPVVPGTIFLAYHLAAYLKGVATEKLALRAALLGMIAGLVNISLSVLFAFSPHVLVRENLQLDIIDLLQSWALDIPMMIKFGAPIALPLGLFFGLSLAWMEKRGRTLAARAKGLESRETL